MDGVWFTDDDTQAFYSACEMIFTGHRFDSEAGLYCFRYRFYLPPLGRLLSRDFWSNQSNLYPFTISRLQNRLLSGHRNEINLYQYVRSNPLRFIDPSGASDPTNSLHSSYGSRVYRVLFCYG